MLVIASMARVPGAISFYSRHPYDMLFSLATCGCGLGSLMDVGQDTELT